jgi:hypothetical protein
MLKERGTEGRKEAAPNTVQIVLNLRTNSRSNPRKTLRTKKMNLKRRKEKRRGNRFGFGTLKFGLG